MRKVAAILLFCCLVFTLLGYHVIYKVRLTGIKSEMKARLRSHTSSEVITLIFNQADRSQLKWEDGSEIRYGKEMYDVIDTITLNDQLILRCIHDEKEQELVENYQKLHDDSPSPLQTRLVKLMTTFFIPAAYVHYTLLCYTDKINYCLYRGSDVVHYASSPDRPPCIS